MLKLGYLDFIFQITVANKRNCMNFVAVKQIKLHMFYRKWFWILRPIANNRKLQLTGLQLSGEHCTA